MQPGTQASGSTPGASFVSASTRPSGRGSWLLEAVPRSGGAVSPGCADHDSHGRGNRRDVFIADDGRRRGLGEWAAPAAFRQAPGARNPKRLRPAPADRTILRRGGSGLRTKAIPRRMAGANEESDDDSRNLCRHSGMDPPTSRVDRQDMLDRTCQGTLWIGPRPCSQPCQPNRPEAPVSAREARGHPGRVQAFRNDQLIFTCAAAR